MVRIGMAEAGTAVTLDGGGGGGQSANAEVVSEDSADFPTLELEGLGEGVLSSQAEAGRQAQLSKQARAGNPWCVPSSKESSRASAGACADCWENSCCIAAMVPRLSGLIFWYSSGHRAPAPLSRDAHWSRICSLLGAVNREKRTQRWR
jgi:hypothetical protein